MKTQYQNQNNSEEKTSFKDLKVRWQKERGITLIALIISIIVVVLLVAITIKSITGDDPIIGISANTVEDHKVVSYKEQIEQTMHAKIVSKSAIGEIATTGDIENLLDSQDWVTEVALNPSATADSGDVVVQTNEGYVFQAYYNNVYGYTDIEYIGKNLELSKKLTINATYEKPVAQIYATSEDQTGNVTRHDIIHKYQIVGGTDNPSGQQKYNIKDIGTGWYKVKATSNSGATKFAWVRATNTKDALTKPTIEIETAGKANNGWYGADKEDLWIKISTTSPSAKTIHYALSGAHTQAEKTEPVSGAGEKSIRFQITETGITNIVAWTEDETEKYQSEEAYESVKFDNKPPEVTEIELTGTEGQNGWYISDIDLKVNARDLNGKAESQVEDPTATINGYNYTLLDANGTELKKETHIPNIETTISTINLAKEDGIYVFHITAEDLAGNKSTTKVITIQKDKTAPTIKTPVITNETEVGFTVTVEAEDQTSGIDHYEYYINGTLAHTDTSNTWTPNNLNPNQTYNITVKAIDRAGLNSNASNNVPAITKGELLPPEVQISGNTRNGYYIGDVTIQVRDTSDSTKTRVNRIKVTGGPAEQIINGTSGSFIIATDGTYTISAVSIDAQNNESTPTTKPAFTRDATAPSSSNITYQSQRSNTITVTANAQDATSGIKDYTYQYKETSINDADNQWKTATTTGANYTYPSSMITAGKTYDLRVIANDNAGWTRASEKIIVVINSAPVVRTVTYVSKTTNSITVKARATDEQNDALTYTMYVSTDNVNWTQKATSSSVSSGTEVTLTANGLTEYTYYYIKVRATETNSRILIWRENVEQGANLLQRIHRL